jgi:hypothetical protein
MTGQADKFVGDPDPHTFKIAGSRYGSAFGDAFYFNYENGTVNVPYSKQMLRELDK